MFTYAERNAMELAMGEARKGGKQVFPNPRVGAAIIDGNGDVVALGYHACCGGSHAERDALEKADDVSGFTMVVTLEPCCHHGRTPPCVEAIEQAGIKRVVVGLVDPDPQVSGKGIEYLKDRGIEVETGLLDREIRELNRVYLHHRKTGRSFLHLKMAGTLDGRSTAADGSSRWITSPESRKRVHEFRRDSHAVLVGGRTAAADDPSLTVRDVDCSLENQPVRIIYTNTDLPFDLKVFSTPGRTVVACGKPVKVPDSAELWDGITSLRNLLERTADQGMGLVICEGGKSLAGSMIRQRLVDRLSIFTAPALLGESGLPLIGDLGIGSIDEIILLQDVSVSRTGKDILTEGRFVYRAD